MLSEETHTTLPRSIENPVIKDRVTFIRLAAETGGACTEVSVTLMPGGGTPLHYHKALTEMFEVVSGELGVEAARENHLLKPGSSVTVPPGTPHRFYNPGSEPVVFHTIITPGSSGFERSLRILYGLAADGLTDRKGLPRSLKHLAILADISDMHSTGILSLLDPLLRRLARKAKQSGEYEALIRRYCS